MAIRIGTAGWAIGRLEAEHFPADGSSLERYAARFPVVEINSSFHRSHRHTTWARWREAVPANFRFSVKVPKTITHQHLLQDCDQLLDEFLVEVAYLGEKLGALLLQLPPRLEFDLARCETFLRKISQRATSAVICEPRHPSWMTGAANDLLISLRVARAAADPAITPGATLPGGWAGLSYFRLHGSPVMYRSSYADRIVPIAKALFDAGADSDVWCIFDNTASSAAIADALALQAAIGRGGGGCCGSLSP